MSSNTAVARAVPARDTLDVVALRAADFVWAARTTLFDAARPTIEWDADVVFTADALRGVAALRAETVPEAGMLITDAALETVVAGRRVAERDATPPLTVFVPAVEPAET